MHVVVMDSLEEYLAGMLEPATQRKIEAHLSACKMCREEIHSMQDVSSLFGALRSDEMFEPSTNFYAGVRQQIAESKPAPSFAGIFAMDFALGRRLVFASLITLAVLGSYLVSSEIEYQAGPSPAAIMAEQDSPSFDAAPARDNMLVTLTAYEQH
ncbi:MAG TPA: zf-HC2 domain-containing protein [Bryobacteraceae bacterium]|nr:zf-HC2 domain-containing protein [Bryobacteraceae bacterium]